MSYLMEDSSRDQSYGGDPLRPATPRWRSPRPMVAARCARLRRAGDPHVFV